MLNLTPFAATRQAALATLAGNAAQALKSAHQLAALNLQATRATLAEWAAVTQGSLSAKGPAEFGTLQISALQAAPQKALAYGLQVKEILGSATLGQQGAIDAQLADVQAKFLEAVHVKTVQRWIREGILPATRKPGGRLWKVPKNYQAQIAEQSTSAAT